MSWAAVAVAGVTYGVKTYKGYQQKKKGEKALSRLETPEYKIPNELYESLSDAEKSQVEGLPAEQKAEFVKNIERTQQSSLKASAERKGGLLGLQSSTSQETDAYTNLVQMDASARKQSKLQKKSEIERARARIARAKGEEFNVRENRYQQGLASAQGLIGAGEQNFMGGVSGLSSTAIGAIGSRQGTQDELGQGNLGGN